MKRYSTKETYNLIDPTDRSHPISCITLYPSASTFTDRHYLQKTICRFIDSAGIQNHFVFKLCDILHKIVFKLYDILHYNVLYIALHCIIYCITLYTICPWYKFFHFAIFKTSGGTNSFFVLCLFIGSFIDLIESAVDPKWVKDARKRHKTKWMCIHSSIRLIGFEYLYTYSQINMFMYISIYI